jgi:hypothetical protein
VRKIASAVGVSLSTVSLWVRDVELTKEQRAALDAQDPTLNPSARGTGWGDSRRRLRAAAQREGREAARAGDALHTAGCMLFWAEGSRHRNSVVFTNADVVMHRLFIRFLVECCGVERSDIALTVNCYLGNGFTLEEIEAWGLAELELPSTVLRTSIVNRPSRSSKGKRRSLPMGTARLVVHSTRLVQSLYGAIQEYGGFERPEWLDMGTITRTA